jgi:type VI secretion system secreted protein Hcp
MDDTKHRSTVGHHLLVGALAAAASVGATSAVATTDMFLKIGDIKGESTDVKHADEIEVLAWSWGVNGAVTGGAQKGGAQPACAQPLVVDKYVDRATPPLVTNAALNTTIPTAKLTVRKAGGEQIEVVVVNLTGVTVKAVSNGGAAVDDRMTEKVALGFTSATIIYTPQKADGSADTGVTASTPASCP